MNTVVEISVIVLVAAAMVAFALVICLLARRRSGDAAFERGMNWLVAGNALLLLAAAGMSLHPRLPFALSAFLVLGGAHLGIVAGYCGVQCGLGQTPHLRFFAWFSSAALLGQAGVAVLAETAQPLFVTSSAINGVMALVMARLLWPAVRPLGGELSVLVTLPFFVIALGYALRLLASALGLPDAVLITSSAVIAFVLAFSALQWAFALIALRAARLNRSLERERQQAQDMARARTRFLAHMSHEIRTPLNGVLGLVDVLAADVTDRAARETLAQIQTSGSLLVHILNDVLDMAKLEAGAVQPEAVPFEPGAVLRQVMASFGPQCRAGGVTLTLAEAPDTAGHWSGDPHRTSQILHNIIGNAVKFSPGGTVGLALSAPAEGGVLFEITDTGIGMTEAQIAALFQEFMQADAGITRRFGGTGLGMAITHRLVTLMGGTISAASAPGIGTRFAVALPLGRVAAPVPAVAEAPVAPADLSRLRVLCADDSRTNRLVLDKMLRPMGIDPMIVDDGHAAVAAATAAAFDIYLFDISMPGLSGLETLHLIRGIEAAQRRSPARAVAVTANVMPEDVAHYLASGFETHLAKPIRLPALRSLLEGLHPAEGYASPLPAAVPARRDLN